jgi:hypothetical protein
MVGGTTPRTGDSVRAGGALSIHIVQ